MLVYRARLGAAGAAVLTVTARPLPPAAGGGPGRLRTPCQVVVRYALPGGHVRRHRGRFWADLAPGVGLRVVACQVDGDEALITLRPAPLPRHGGARSHGAAVADRFTLPVSFQAWGVTALSGAAARLRLICRAREDQLLLRGLLHLTLNTPGDTTLRLQVPFVRVLAAEVPQPLKWRAHGGVTGLHMRVEAGGRISGEVVLAVRCQGWAAPPAGAAEFAVLHEVTGQAARVVAEPAGHGHSVVRGAVDLDLYGTDATGRSRWAGRSVPFSALLPVEGERLEGHARIERLSQRGLEVQIALEAGVTGLRPETILLGAATYRAERIVGSATTSLLLTESIAAPAGPNSAPWHETRNGFLPIAGPGAGWAEVAVALSTPQVSTARGAGRWSVRAVVGGTPAGEPPYPAPLKGATGGSADLDDGEALTVAPALLQVDGAGIRVRTALVRGPAVPLAPRPAEGEAVCAYLPLPSPTNAVLGLHLAPGGEIAALIRAGGLHLLQARVLPQSVTATAFPMMQNGMWQLCIMAAKAKNDT